MVAPYGCRSLMIGDGHQDPPRSECQLSSANLDCTPKVLAVSSHTFGLPSGVRLQQCVVFMQQGRRKTIIDGGSLNCPGISPCGNPCCVQGLQKADTRKWYVILAAFLRWARTATVQGFTNRSMRACFGRHPGPPSVACFSGNTMCGVHNTCQIKCLHHK